MVNSNAKSTLPSAREVYFPDTVNSEEASAMLEERFFRIIRLPNGTYKTTAADRLTEVDTALCQCLKDATKNLNILDVGISSGVTSLELLDALTQQGFQPHLTVSDLTIHTVLKRLPGGLDVLCDSKGHILQLALSSVVKGRPHDPFLSIRRAVLQLAIVLLESLIKMGIFQKVDAKAVTLISPRLLNKPKITIVEHDLNDNKPEWQVQFDVVRAANVLNEAYFSRLVLKRMLAYLLSYVKPNGFLVLARTRESDNSTHGTIYKISTDGKYCVVCRIGDGSELEDIMQELINLQI